MTNIQQLQGDSNRWLNSLPSDFFDLILFDEGHHSVAQTWTNLKDKFPNAKIVNFSATPLRADGQRMSGNIIYSFPVARAITQGYVKRLKAVTLNPKTLKFVRREDGQEVEVNLEEVKKLGEEDADFRRSIVTSKETLTTIVDASIRKLNEHRKMTGDNRLKIIASALNYEHCRQIVEAYKSRGLRADYVHSKEDGAANDKVMRELENHELDVIVQVRKLNEGFDHPFLVVAAVFSIFSNLSPFIQFVGRIMRVIEQNSPDSKLNCGTVVFHSGANIHNRWTDFQDYSEADQKYFEQLLPLEELDFSSSDELELEPEIRECDVDKGYDVSSQSQVHLEEIPLITNDPEARQALQTLIDKGFNSEQINQAYNELLPVPTTKVKERQAKRSSLDVRIKTEVGKILASHNLTYVGHDLDRNHLGKTNFVILKSEIDRAVNSFVSHTTGERSEFTRDELDRINDHFDTIVQDVIKDLFDGKN